MSIFQLQHATGTRVVKGEDVIFIHPLTDAHLKSMLYMVCDGHAGRSAAGFVAQQFHRYLSANLPASYPDPKFAGEALIEEFKEFAEGVQRALCEAFVRVDNDWMEKKLNAGTTVTVLVVIGQLLTVANIGDSTAVLDTGCSMLELTSTHRIHDSKPERERLLAAGCKVVPLGFHLQGPAKPGDPGVGPLRIWPGGLCVSRSIGDADAGPEVVPIPHIKQVLVPEGGCRVIVASDGLWDVVTLAQAVTSTRSFGASAAAAELMIKVNREHRIIDDTSIVIVDVLPLDAVSFPGALTSSSPPATSTTTNGNQSSSSSKKKAGGGFCGCFGTSEMEEPDSRHVTGRGSLQLFSDVDCLTAFPSYRERLYRNACVKRSKSGRRQELLQVMASALEPRHEAPPNRKAHVPIVQCGLPAPSGGGCGVSDPAVSIRLVDKVALVRGPGRDLSNRGVLDEGTGRSGTLYAASTATNSPTSVAREHLART